jgi:hypothetical protein
MLAVVGWVAVDFGLRFPGEEFASIPSSFAAHTASVSNGSLGLVKFIILFFPLFNKSLYFLMNY